MIKKHLFLLPIVLFSAISVFAQSKKELEIKASIWGENDTQKGNIDIPEKWQNESAVVLYKEYFYDYHKFIKNVNYQHSYRKRIKLLDKAAIEDYSEFTFTKKFAVNKGWVKRGKNYVGIKVIKPDGTEREIEVDKEAVKTDDEYKIAISGLEKGDILDYYIYSVEPFKQKDGFVFDPVTKIISDDYPIKKMALHLHTENDFYVKFNSYNGAPKLQEIATDKKSEKQYYLEAEDIDKNDFPYWYYPLQELPHYKFQISFARKGYHKNDVFEFISPEQGVVKTNNTKEDVLDLYKVKWRYGIVRTIKELENSLKEKDLTTEEKIREAYYYFRHYYLTQFVERSIYASAKIIPDMVYGSTAYDAYSFSMDNSNLMGIFLYRAKIPYSIITATPRSYGTMKNMLFKSDITNFLAIEVEGKTLYLPPLGLHSNIGEIHYGFENSDAYNLKVDIKKHKISEIEGHKITPSTYKDNGTREYSTLSFNEDMDALAVTKTTKHLGHSKTNTQDELLIYYDFINEDYKRFDNDSYVDKQIKKEKDKKRINAEAAALVKKIKKNQAKYIEEQTEDQYDFSVEDHEFTIANTGRYGIKQPLVLEEKFNITEHLIKKAGPNYLIEIGKLIGGQVTLTEEEKNRTNNIYMNFPRSFVNEIEFTIPSGYVVGSLDKLNISVENETGGFISTATVEDSILKIRTEKYYANYYEPNTNWSKMVQFLEAAYQYTQEKIILKKAAL
ncbi:hypothetical protein [uncultured Maribacter sp.]|uniref:hypothetical protein n=1 Tax=uncultured Maribacter sp. TaxID=431308 RepID=UPI00261AC53A|nr:hypothetical protein [uncultured Maribacter sp.]